MKNSSFVGYAKSFKEKYSFINFNSFKEAKRYVNKNYPKSLFYIETDFKTTFLIIPKF